MDFLGPSNPTGLFFKNRALSLFLSEKTFELKEQASLSNA